MTGELTDEALLRVVRAEKVEYAVMNFTTVDPSTTTYGSQATLIQIELFMDVTRSFMDSVDWVERYFYFGAMYEMVSRVCLQDRELLAKE